MSETTMEAGRELDALIAERVMGWQRFPYLMGGTDDSGIVESMGSTVVTVHHCPPGRVHVSTIARVPNYSTDIAAAWKVVCAFHREPIYLRYPEFIAALSELLGDESDFLLPIAALLALEPQGAAHAICRAALLAVGGPP